MFYAAVLEVPSYFALEGLAQYFVLILLKLFYSNKNFDMKRVYKMKFLSMPETNPQR